MNIPQHVAIILDGNGRWAKMRGMPRTLGHVRGARNLEIICEDAWDLGIKYLTVYLFSTENWHRSKAEVDALMQLFRRYTKTSVKRAMANNMRVRVIGVPEEFDTDLQKNIHDLVETTKNNTGLNFQLALNYGSRDEITRAVRRAMADAVSGKIAVEDLSEQVFSSYLDTAGIPDPDLLIRTGGEQRLSNYLLWQMAYTEFYFTDTLWPVFHKSDLEKAISVFNERERRFGGVIEEKEDV